jgi:hypothetical protein
MSKLLTAESQEISELLPYNLLSMGELKEIASLLEFPKRIAITTHHKPDADALRTEEAVEKSNLKPNITMAMQIAMMGIRALFSPVTSSQLSGLPYLLMFSFECSQLLFNFSSISFLLVEREQP